MSLTTDTLITAAQMILIGLVILMLFACSSTPEIATAPCIPNKMFDLDLTADGRIESIEFDPRPNGGCPPPPTKFWDSRVANTLVGGFLNLGMGWMGHHYGSKNQENIIDGFSDMSSDLIRYRYSDQPTQLPTPGDVYNVTDSYITDETTSTSTSTVDWSSQTYESVNSFNRDSRQGYDNYTVPVGF
jgi:hypothetical protein